MSGEPSFKMSQDYELIPPKKKRAYPILVEEWNYLKNKISAIRDDANLYHTIGSILLGVAGSAITTALTLDLPKSPEGQTAMPIIISWFISASSLVCGGLSLFFGHNQRQVQKASASEVIQQMGLIEQRYETEET
jgi:hypothetical protein